MKRTLIIFALILMLYPFVQAQQGYFGKRFNFYLDATACPAWFSENRNEEKGISSFDMLYSPGVSVTVSGRNELGLAYHFGKTIFPVAKDVNNFVDTSLLPASMFFRDLDVYGISFEYRYHHNLSSPLGTHTRIRISRFWYTAYMDGRNRDEGAVNSALVGISVGGGKTYLIHDYITITPSWMVGMAFGEGKITNYLDDATPETLADRKIRHLNYFNISVAIGILPF